MSGAPGVPPALPDGADTGAARQRLAAAQAALLSALVAQAPVPRGFDPVRVRVQERALRAKRAEVTAAVAPELPVLLGDGYRPAFSRYAERHPLPGGARADALAFARWLLAEERAARRADGGAAAAPAGQGLTRRQRRALLAWLRERAEPAPRRGAGRLLALRFLDRR